MINKINDLKKEVGRKYEMFFEDGNYQGCFFPFYFVFIDIPKFPLPTADPADNWDYGIDLIKKHCIEISKDEIQPGDMLVTRFKKELHVALYIGDERIIHVFRDNSLQISRVQMFRELLTKWYRIKL